jgi:hypothetical protein
MPLDKTKNYNFIPKNGSSNLFKNLPKLDYKKSSGLKKYEANIIGISHRRVVQLFTISARSTFDIKIPNPVNNSNVIKRRIVFPSIFYKYRDYCVIIPSFICLE